jgi:hypothetical protein
LSFLNFEDNSQINWIIFFSLWNIHKSFIFRDLVQRPCLKKSLAKILPRGLSQKSC